jgi:hypothetical protein
MNYHALPFGGITAPATFRFFHQRLDPTDESSNVSRIAMQTGHANYSSSQKGWVGCLPKCFSSLMAGVSIDSHAGVVIMTDTMAVKLTVGNSGAPEGLEDID